RPPGVPRRARPSMCAARRPPDRPPQRPARMPRARRWWALGGLMLAMAAAGAGFSTASAADREADQVTADSTRKGDGRRALTDDPVLKQYSGDIWVSVRGTSATLSGQLPSEVLKRRALLVARQVKGIAEVRDELEVVTPTGEPDLPSPFPDGLPTGRPKG